MKEKITLEGRSLIFNIAFITLNLIGLTFLVLGYHDNFEENSTLYLTIGLILMMATTGGLIVFKGRMLMSSVSRVLVGGLFIVSGLVKANDPLGFSYKLEEYFEDGALAFRIKEWFSAPSFSMEFFIDYALLFSVIICIAEIVLGVLTIIGGKIKLVSYLMLLMMLFFTFLTWHTATCENDVKFVDQDTYQMTDPLAQMKIDEAKDNDDLKIISQSETELVVEEMKLPQCVDDCGCFGDAMKGSVGRSLTPKESLWKDIVLVYLVLWIFLAKKQIKPNNRKENLIFVSTSLIVIAFFSWVFGWYFPLLFGIVSIIGALWILRSGGKFLGNYWGSALIVTILCLFMVTYVLRYQPIKDYRAYAVGANLVDNMNDGIAGEYQSLLVYKNKSTGETVEYDSASDEYMASKIWEDSDWEYVSMVQKEIVATKIPSITAQFSPFISIYDVSENELQLADVQEKMDAAKMEGLKLMDIVGNYEVEVAISEYNSDDYPLESYTILDTISMMDPNVSEITIRDLIVQAPMMVLVSSKTLNDGDWRHIDRLKEIHKTCIEKGIPFAVMCGASREDINAFREKHQFFAPFFVNDETEMKAISRSNPVLMIIENGVMKAKYAFRSTPTNEAFKKIFLK